MTKHLEYPMVTQSLVGPMTNHPTHMVCKLGVRHVCSGRPSCAQGRGRNVVK